MGMNYYTQTKKCPTCGHKPEGIHLGKASVGWQFSFQYNGGQFYKNVEEMKAWLSDKEIENEYGEPVTHEEFWAIVSKKQNPTNKNHAEYCRVKYPSSAQYEHVIDGYSFTDREFG